MFQLHRSPPIQYLPAFVAAAGHNSFKMAANQLNVSPSAISQQIKVLERHLGLALFSREKKQIRLTMAGISFYKVAQMTLNHYEAGYSQFVEQHTSPTLKISMIPYIANEVVIPKLDDFQQQHPNINLVVQTSTQLENLQEQDIDAAIRFGVPPWPEHNVSLISPAQSCLVASPAYLAAHPINNPNDWQQQTLIHSRTHVNDWQRFTDNMQLNLKQNRQLYFDSYDASIRAAEEGLGIAMAVLPISNPKLTQQKLTTFSKTPFPLNEAFYLVTNPNEGKQHNYQALLSWLTALFNVL